MSRMRSMTKSRQTMMMNHGDDVMLSRTGSATRHVTVTQTQPQLKQL